MTLDGKQYRELAAIPANRPFVSHVRYTDDQGRKITLFPAFRSLDNLDQISRVQSPVKMNTVPLGYKENQNKYENKYHEIVKEYGPKKDEPGNFFIFGRDEMYKSESSGNSNLKPKPPLRVSVAPSGILNPDRQVSKDHSFQPTSQNPNSEATFLNPDRQVSKDHSFQPTSQNPNSEATFLNPDRQVSKDHNFQPTSQNPNSQTSLNRHPPEIPQNYNPQTTFQNTNSETTFLNPNFQPTSLNRHPPKIPQNQNPNSETTFPNSDHPVPKGYNPQGSFLNSDSQITSQKSFLNSEGTFMKPNPVPAPRAPDPPPAPPMKDLDLSPRPGHRYFRSQTVPRMRYIYAFPEEVRNYVSHRDPGFVEVSGSDEIEKPFLQKRGISFENEKNPQKSVLEELKSKLSRQESHSLASQSTIRTVQKEKKESKPVKVQKIDKTYPIKNQKSNLDQFYSIPKNLQPGKNPQQSPDTFGSTTNASNFSYKPVRRSLSHDSVVASEAINPDIAQFLKDTPSHIRPVVKRFITSQFENPQKELNHTEWSETEIPMKHYWQKVFKVKEGKKTATIKIENLLSIEPEIGPFYGFSKNETNSLIQKQISENSSKKESERRISIDSGTLSAESGFSPSPHHSRSPESSPRLTENDMDLLTVVLKKIRQKKPIDWPELFLLKNDHCRFVVIREKELKKLRKIHPTPSEATLLERDIVDNYRGYQRALEQAIVVDELYTRLAYLIMRAESYWYAAKITSDQTLRHHFYALARHNYGDLLVEAKTHLEPDDKSLLTILDKMTQILIESSVSDPEIVANCRRAVFEAEKTLESRPDVKKERKIIKIKNNLIFLK